ncbi:MAG: type II toxin-antitoxin system prevent-host-death family antitoxin [Planctomycetes bacterium]|nr:type II toxin-antitoxin system prevent-host-death family antitoxin [Planctomycetota bacterium]
MKTLVISEFKAKCIAELKALRETGGELEITLRGKPLARVIPIRDGARQLGTQAGSMEIRGDIIASDFDDDFRGEEATRAAQRSKA